MTNFWNSWQAFALGSAMFAALTAVFGKIGVSGLNSNFATFIRTVVILMMTAVVLWSRNEWQRIENVSRTALLFLVLSGLATGFSWLCYYRALQLGPASKVAPVDKLSVVFIILLSVLFLGEPFTLKVALGGALIFTGSLVLIF